MSRISSQRQRLRLTILSRAVAMAIGAIVAPVSAIAVSSCDSGAAQLTIDGAESLNCRVGAGQSLEITSTGILEVTRTAAVTMVGADKGFVNHGVIRARDPLMGPSLGLEIRASSLQESVVNAGLIHADGAVFITGSTLAGALVNRGELNGFVDMVDSTIAGGIRNSGTIRSTLSLYGNNVIGGVFNQQGATIGWFYANAGSVISGAIDNAGAIGQLNVDNTAVSDGIRNTGTIGAAARDDSALRMIGSQISGGVLNAATGAVDGARHAILVSGGALRGGIVNAGRISATGALSGMAHEGGVGIALENNAAVDTLVNNAGGQVTGSAAGITIDGATVSGDILNEGNITGGEVGLRVGGNAVVGRIVNLGVIAGAGHAIDIVAETIVPGPPPSVLAGGSVANGITNAGSLLGAVELGGATLNMEGRSSRVTGAVTGNAASVVHLNGGFTTENTFDVGAFNIAATGVLGLAHGVTTRSGFSNAGVVSVAAGDTRTITGDYRQSGAGVLRTGVSPTAHGRLVVTGTADLSAASNIDVDVVSGPLVDNRLHAGVLSAGNLLTAPVINVTDNSALFNFTAMRNGNAIDLTTVAVPTGVEDAVDNPATPVVTPPVAPPAAVTPPVVPTPVEPVVTPPVAPSVTPPLAATPVVATPVGPVLTPPVVAAPAPPAPASIPMTPSANPASRGAARVFDALIARGGNAPAAMAPVIDALGSLGTKQEVADAVAQTLPLMTAGMAQASLNTMHGTNQAIAARQDVNLGRSSGDALLAERGFWIKPVGSWARQDDRSGVAGYKADTRGLIAGADGRLSSRALVGTAFSYTSTKVDSNSGAARQHAAIDGYQAVLYGAYDLDGATTVNWQGDIGKNRADGYRNIGFGGLNARADSDYTSWAAHAGLGLGRTLELDERTLLTPSVRVDYTRLRADSYTETGAGALNLRVGSRTVEELIVGVDGNLRHALDSGVALVANLGAGYDTLSERALNNAAFVGGGAVFATEGLAPSPWIGRGGVGVIMSGTGKYEITARYDVEARENFVNHTASVKLGMMF